MKRKPAALALSALFHFVSLGSAEETKPANTLTIDAFDYADSASAERIWRPMTRGESGLEVGTSNGQAVARVSAPFGSNADIPRVSVDRDLSLDPAPATLFTLQMRQEGEPVSGRVTLYFRSGKGWYSAGASFSKPGWLTLTFTKEDFHEEHDVAGWNRIDGVRISIWRPEEKKENRDSAFALRALKAHWNDTAILLPHADSPEFRTSESVAQRIASLLKETGIGTDIIAMDSLPSGSLGARPLVILPHNPVISAEVDTVLETFAAKGGKLLASYSLPGNLGKTLGFESGDYYAQERPGSFAAIRFDASDLSGLPAVVRQVSWNIRTAKPVAHNARVIAEWLDDKGEPTGNAAMLLSDRGAYFSHVILDGDNASKRAMLTAVLGKLHPGLWKEATRNAWAQVERVGHCLSATELAGFVGDNARGAARLTAADQQISRSRELLQNGDGVGALQAVERARVLRVEAYLMSQPSREVEARAFWNHSGTGAYPGDWDRTAREMADAGLNMVLPNMLWGGMAHYASDVLPRSKTFEAYGDQIEQCVTAARKHGIEVHVWKVNYNLGRGVPEEFVKELREADRLQVDVDGEPGDWLNPAHPDNFQLELDSILEVVRKYDIDGFHFDYIRYPNSRNDFSDFSRRKFEADTGHKVENWPGDCFDGPLKAAYTDWRCAQITRLVKAVSEQARKIRPGIKISAAVFRDYPSCRDWVAQDWPLWAGEGYVDFLCPMDYTDDDEKYMDWITTQKSQVPEGFPLYPGIGMSLRSKTQGADRVVGQIYLNRKVGTGGFTIFNLNETTLADIAAGLVLGAGKTRATPPHRVKNP